VCVCVHVCMNAHTNVCTYVCMHVFMYVINMCMYVFDPQRQSVCADTHTHTRTRERERNTPTQDSHMCEVARANATFNFFIFLCHELETHICVR
jgi:hypothetical protein